MAIVFSKSSGLNDSIYGKSQEPIKMLLEKEVEAFEQMSAIPKLFKTINSDNFAEKLTSMTALDEFSIVAEGGEYPLSDMQEGFSKVVEPVTWKNSFSVTKEMIEDNKMLSLNQKAVGFIDSYNRSREQYAAALLAGGVTGTATFKGATHNCKSADNMPLFYNEHPSVIAGGAKQSNKFADAFSVDALGAAESAMQDFRDDKGNVLNVAPDTIIIPNNYKLKKAVFEAIGSDKDPATSNNGYNYQFGRWNVIIWPYLGTIEGATAPWILMDSKYNQSRGGAVMIERVKLNVKSYIEDKTDNNVWAGRARFAGGFNNWRAFAIGGVTGGTTLVD